MSIEAQDILRLVELGIISVNDIKDATIKAEIQAELEIQNG